MTPAEMVDRINRNIEAARAVMDEAPCGYVLHTKDHAVFLSEDGTCLCSPRAGAVMVRGSYGSAVKAKRRWNGKLDKDDSANAVVISLRHEALQAYIDWQQAMLDALIEMASHKRKRRSNALQ